MPPQGQDESDDSAFRCITKRGEIRPNKKFEMVFEFAPLTTDTKESFWKFMLLGQKLEEHFLIVGQVEEPRVGMDSPAIMLQNEPSEPGCTPTPTVWNTRTSNHAERINSPGASLSGRAPPTAGPVAAENSTTGGQRRPEKPWTSFADFVSEGSILHDSISHCVSVVSSPQQHMKKYILRRSRHVPSQYSIDTGTGECKTQ